MVKIFSFRVLVSNRFSYLRAFFFAFDKSLHWREPGTCSTGGLSGSRLTPTYNGEKSRTFSR